MLLSSILLAGAMIGQMPAVADLELRDLHDGAESLADHQGHVVVVMVVTARRLRNLKAWEEELSKRYGDLHYLRIADVPEEPPVTHEMVAEKLIRRVPEEVPILIDLERRWATELDLDTGRPNLLLFDGECKLAATYRGRMEPPLLQEVIAAIDALLEAP